MSTVSSTSSTTASTGTNSATNTILVSGDEFLTILVAQLENQDPLDPTDANQFVTELAQLSQVQYLTNIYSAVEDLGSVIENGTMGELASTIGGYMVVDDKAASTGDKILLAPAGEYDTITLTLTDSSDNTKTISFDSDDSPVYEVTDGSYTITGATASLDGKEVTCSTTVYRYIAGVQSGDTGAMLVAGDGTTYPVSDISLITK